MRGCEIKNRRRIQLLRELYETVLSNTASFEEDNIGSDLAYLMGAVLEGSRCDWDANQAFVKLLREHLPRSHPIWGYIHVEGAQFGCGALSDRELATILAALRFWQCHGQTDADPSDDVASDSGRHKVLCSAEINRLCERLNFSGESTTACDG